MKLSILLCATLCVSTAANAASVCNTDTLMDVHAVEDASSIVRKGEGLGNVSMYAKTATGDMFCVEGGYCYPAHVGKKLAQRLLNCSIDFRHPETGGEQTDYNLIVNRHHRKR